MNLKLVTWECDLTQFLVDAGDNASAIKKAIAANKEIDVTFHDKDMDEHSTYTVEDVDFNLLNEIICRNDYNGIYGEAIVYND